MNAPTKRCSRCKLPKPLDDFDRRNDTVDGRQDYCKECRREYQRDDRLRTREVLEIAQRAREALAIFGRDLQRTMEALKSLSESSQRVHEEVSKLGKGGA